MVKAPDCKWSQRSDKVMLTLNVPNLDAAKTNVNITETAFSFKSEDFELKFDFFGPVNPADSKWNVGARDVQFVFMRKEAGEYWDKLQKGSKILTLKVDWDKWKDEDEQNNDDMDMSGFDNFDFGGGGGGDMPDSDDDDEDDDAIPGLEEEGSKPDEEEEKK
mmetsp:Transcript_61792/g.145335  ORF Transcript_61792/g.145335 Transcript_61792/m.145335 type:complete len:162 (-) Transcript_61792:177-662(-)